MKKVKGKKGKAKPKNPKALDPKKDFDKPVRKPRQGRLAGMEDSAIKDLEEAAIEHSEKASEILAAKGELRSIKERITTLMKANGKKEYRRAGIHLKLRAGHEDVSVQVKRHDRVDDEPAAAAEESGEGTEV
jgi:hypothetical protein